MLHMTSYFLGRFTTLPRCGSPLYFQQTSGTSSSRFLPVRVQSSPWVSGCCCARSLIVTLGFQRMLRDIPRSVPSGHPPCAGHDRSILTTRFTLACLLCFSSNIFLMYLMSPKIRSAVIGGKTMMLIDPTAPPTKISL
jgi:hypothetical protein